MRAWRKGHLTAFVSSAIAIAAVAVGGAGTAPASAAARLGGSAAAAPSGAPSAGALPAGAPAAGAGLPGDEQRVCPRPDQPGQVACQAVYQLAGQPGQSGQHGPAAAFVPDSARVPGYGPPALRRAYGLTKASPRRGVGQTVAVVDAFSDPNAERDLAAYRHHFGLRPCTVASGCLRIINQNGKAKPLPARNASWAVEQSLDLDMVSAACPRCHLLLVEASAPTNKSLGRAENAAVQAGARVVSNSWSGPEFRGQWIYNHYFNHPGRAIVFAAGDAGYGTVFPADLQFVTSVGGTTLRHAASGRRSWTETAWGSATPASGGTGSGCSSFTTKPSWQVKPVDIAASGCPYRTQNDVAAVADPATGVAVYDTFQTHGTWAELGGTSAAAPIIAGMYALAGAPAPRTYPASYLYQHPKAFHDVTSGRDGVCPAVSSYLCQAQKGFDGPTGVGTPNGTYGLSPLRTRQVTLVDPGNKSVSAGAAFSLKVTGLDVRPKVRSLAWTATGLPPGLKLTAVPGTTKAVISGSMPAYPMAGTVYRVAITGTDRVTKAAGVTRFTITVSRPQTLACRGRLVPHGHAGLLPPCQS